MVASALAAAAGIARRMGQGQAERGKLPVGPAVQAVDELAREIGDLERRVGGGWSRNELDGRSPGGRSSNVRVHVVREVTP